MRKPLETLRLCSKNEYTKSESNSQRLLSGTPIRHNCVQRTNIQNLKAIHNPLRGIFAEASLCSKNEYTKSESNSQLAARSLLISANCVQRTNIQNLKAIHNVRKDHQPDNGIVFKERIYKI